MASYTGGSGLWRPLAAVLAVIAAVLLVSYGQPASAQTPPQVDPWAWGRNVEGQLGNGSNDINAHPNPVQVSNLTDVLAMAGGGSHSLAIKSDGTDDTTANDGTVYAWGNNFQGQLGDGTSGSGTNKNTPVQVSGLTDVVAVAAGNTHSLAIKSDGTGDGSADDGTVYTWGANNFGQLGYDPDPTTPTTFENSNTPSQVSGLTDVVAVAGGTFHSIALRSDGTVWAWGNNDVGQLGNGAIAGSNAPVQVKNPGDPSDPNDDVPLTDVKDVSSGLNHNLAATSTDGAVWAWGCNDYGQLGNSSVPRNPGSNCAHPAFSRTPVQTIGLFNASEVASGGRHSLALADNDNTAPSTTNMLSPQPNAAGWNNSDVTVTLNATDTGGSDVKEITYSATGAQPVASKTVAGSSASVTITTQGTTTITYSAKDNVGNTGMSKTLTVRLDKSAPRVGSVTPPNGTTGVRRGANLTATFSEKMDRATLTSSTFKLFKVNADGSTTQITNVMVTSSGDGLKATLNPFGTSSTLLAANTRYRAMVTIGAKDVAGNRLDQKPDVSGNQPMIWSFKTGSSG